MMTMKLHVKEDVHSQKSLADACQTRSISGLARQDAACTPSHAMALDQLLDSLLVPQANGTLVPASKTAASTVTEAYTQLQERKPQNMALVAIPSSLPTTIMPSQQGHDPFFDAPLSGQVATAQQDDNFQAGGPVGLDIWRAENPDPRQQIVAVQNTKADPEHAVKLTQACSERGLAPVFDYVETLPQHFTALVRFGSSSVTSDGAFPSKKLAKEAVCKNALTVIQALPVGSKKRKSSEIKNPEDRVSAEVLDGFNWIGTLNEYLQRRRLPTPKYSEYRNSFPPFMYSYTLEIADGPPSLFGSETELYSSKLEAKKVSARQAVLWLRAQGFDVKESPVDATHAKKRKRSEACRSASPDHTGLSQVLVDVDVNAEVSLPQQVQELTHSLGFQSPQWKSQPSKLVTAHTEGFIDMAVHFHDEDVRKEPRLAGAIGQLWNINGKKSAKVQCSRGVLRVLEEIKRSRMM